MYTFIILILSISKMNILLHNYLLFRLIYRILFIHLHSRIKYYYNYHIRCALYWQ